MDDSGMSNEFYGVFNMNEQKKTSPTHHKWCRFDRKFCPSQDVKQWNSLSEAVQKHLGGRVAREKRLGPLKPADLSETLWF